jgi:hypothetical protein
MVGFQSINGLSGELDFNYSDNDPCSWSPSVIPRLYLVIIMIAKRGWGNGCYLNLGSLADHTY